MSNTALLAKTAAENKQLRAKIAELEAKLAAADRRAAAEAELVSILKDPRAPLDMKPVDVDDFMAKRAELEALPDLGAVRAAVKMASTRSFTVGDVADGVTTDTPQSSKSSKAERDFENYFLGNSAGN